MFVFFQFLFVLLYLTHRYGVKPEELSEIAEHGEVFRVLIELLSSQPFPYRNSGYENG